MKTVFLGLIILVMTSTSISQAAGTMYSYNCTAGVGQDLYRVKIFHDCQFENCYGEEVDKIEMNTSVPVYEYELLSNPVQLQINKFNIPCKLIGGGNNGGAG